MVLNPDRTPRPSTPRMKRWSKYLLLFGVLCLLCLAAGTRIHTGQGYLTFASLHLCIFAIQLIPASVSALCALCDPMS